VIARKRGPTAAVRATDQNKIRQEPVAKKRLVSRGLRIKGGGPDLSFINVTRTYGQFVMLRYSPKHWLY